MLDPEMPIYDFEGIKRTDDLNVLDMDKTWTKSYSTMLFNPHPTPTC